MHQVVTLNDYHCHPPEPANAVTQFYIMVMWLYISVFTMTALETNLNEWPSQAPCGSFECPCHRAVPTNVFMQLYYMVVWLYITVFAMAARDADLNGCLCQASSC